MSAEVGEEPPVLRMVLFADLGDSTRLYERLGDARAREIASGCLERLETIVAESGGRIVKHIGDEVMCVFVDANDAVAAACEMQRNITSTVADAELTLHIGLHWGPVLPENDDVFGDAVNLAARVVGFAHPRQILTTGATLEVLEPSNRVSTRWIDRRHVKGKQDDVDLYEVIWERSDLTEIRLPGRSQLAMLTISVGDLEIQANDANPCVTIGRGSENDLVISSKLVSRRHARIEKRAGKWVLSDHSTNGTVVTPEFGATMIVHNEQIVLPTAGRIGIGNAASEDGSLSLSFRQMTLAD